MSRVATGPSALGLSRLTCHRPLHPITPRRPNRLDHLLQVLQVLDLDRHVDARVRVRARVVASSVTMLVLMSAMRELSSAIIPLRSSTCIVRRTV